MRPSWKRADRPLIALACALAALLPGAAPAVAATAAPRAGTSDAARFSRAMLSELNRVRAAHRLPAVREDARMDRGALGHSRDMARRGYFAHGSWSGRVMAAAGSARTVGEAIGWRGAQRDAAGEARAMVRDWLASPPHRALLLSGAFTRVGIGRATTSPGGHPAALYTLDFAG